MLDLDNFGVLCFRIIDHLVNGEVDPFVSGVIKSVYHICNFLI